MQRSRLTQLGQTLGSVSQRVLVVDDEPANVDLLRHFLIDIADEIVCLTDSRAAEQTFAEFEPDLVLLDLHMPEPNGLEILVRLRARNLLQTRHLFQEVVRATGSFPNLERPAAS